MVGHGCWRKRRTGAGLPGGPVIMSRRAQLEPLTEPAMHGQANPPFRQRGDRPSSGVAGLPPRLSWICCCENTSRELLCTRQVVQERQHPAVPEIGLAQVGDPEQAVTAA